MRSGVREAFAHNLETGQDIGASVTMFADGEPVVDLWGGYFDAAYTTRGLSSAIPSRRATPRP
jgi:hypothetical protein